MLESKAPETLTRVPGFVDVQGDADVRAVASGAAYVIVLVPVTSLSGAGAGAAAAGGAAMTDAVDGDLPIADDLPAGGSMQRPSIATHDQRVAFVKTLNSESAGTGGCFVALRELLGLLGQAPTPSADLLARIASVLTAPTPARGPSQYVQILHGAAPASLAAAFIGGAAGELGVPVPTPASAAAQVVAAAKAAVFEVLALVLMLMARARMPDQQRSQLLIAFVAFGSDVPLLSRANTRAFLQLVTALPADSPSSSPPLPLPPPLPPPRFLLQRRRRRRGLGLGQGQGQGQGPLRPLSSAHGSLPRASCSP